MTDGETPPDFVNRPWRIGRKVGRTIYAVLGSESSDDDPLIGVMDTHDLAREAVGAHNERYMYGNLQGVLADDRASWPEGHPCRDCGHLYRQHPVSSGGNGYPITECTAWR